MIQSYSKASMTKDQIIFDLDALTDPLRLAKVSVDKGYWNAALSYLDDLECEAIRLRKACEELQALDFLYPNDPAVAQ
jgi:hypothetical protein